MHMCREAWNRGNDCHSASCSRILVHACIRHSAVVTKVYYIVRVVGAVVVIISNELI